MDKQTLPLHVKYWLDASSKHDCFFVVGSEAGLTEKIGAFKVILAGHSEPLRNMLEDSVITEKGNIRIIDVDPETFKLFLKCVYSGVGCGPLIENISMEECINLLYIVEKYLVNTIRHVVISRVLELLSCCEIDSKSFDDIFFALSNRITFQIEKIKSKVLDIGKCNTAKLFESERFLQLPTESVLEIVQLEASNTDEINVWNAVYKWAKYKSESEDGETLRNYMLQLLKYIRFRVMSSEHFCKFVVSTDVLLPEEVIEVCKSFHIPECSLNWNYICSNVTTRYTPPKPSLKVDLVFADLIDVRLLKMKSELYSKEFNYMESSWRILTKKNDLYFEMYLAYTSQSNKGCEVDAEMVLINSCRKPNIIKSYKQKFDTITYNWGWSEFFLWDKLLDQNEGFVQDNKIIVMVILKSS